MPVLIARAVALTAGGAILGAIGGWILGVVVWLVVGVATLNSGTGEAAGDVVIYLSILVGAGLGLFLHFRWDNLGDEIERDHAAASVERERKQEALHRAEVKAQSGLVRELRSRAKRTFGEFRGLVTAAEHHLDLAEEEFAAGAFAPFWDQIEHATERLATYRYDLQLINSIAIEANEQAEKMHPEVPRFRLPALKIPDARTTAGRLAVIVHEAQKNFQFATIYEQRKTNQILVRGFNTLASAIYEIGDALLLSLNDLSTGLNTSLDQLLDATQEHSQQIKEASESNRKLLTNRAKQATLDRSKRERFERDVVKGQERQEKMLDNIQRGRKPRS